MKFTPTSIPDVVLITPDVFGDERGFFMESWNERTFCQAGYDIRFVQDNHSRSAKGVLRGLHHQLPPRAQGKLVRTTLGEVFDVAVDIRHDSPTLGRWVGAWLSDANKQMLWIPPGFAHGFYVLSDVAELLYKCTDYYAPEQERAIRWDDLDLGIDWPIEAGDSPLLSEKDQNAPLWRDAELYG
ncbi:MAG: dTDP-4-dehydrorhamnose 3,5-epimerase [Chloroflexota bacterium]